MKIGQDGAGVSNTGYVTYAGAECPDGSTSNQPKLIFSLHLVEMKTYLERISDLHAKSLEQNINPQAIRMTPSQVAGLEKELSYLMAREGPSYPTEVMGLRIILDERQILDLTA